MAKRDVILSPWPPYKSEPYDPHIRAAIVAWRGGTADQGQQIAAWDWVTNELCRTGEPVYFPNSARDTDFALGMQWVAIQLTAVSTFTAVEKKEPQS